MDINIWNILAIIGLVIMSYVFGYYNGKRFSSSPDFSKKNKSWYYDKKTGVYAVTFLGPNNSDK